MLFYGTYDLGKNALHNKMLHFKVFWLFRYISSVMFTQKVNEYDQEIPKSHTADQPTAPCGRAT